MGTVAVVTHTPAHTSAGSSVNPIPHLLTYLGVCSSEKKISRELINYVCAHLSCKAAL